MMEPLKFLPFSNSVNLRELLYSYHSHSEPTELPLGFYTPIINYIFMHLPTTKKIQKPELKLETQLVL